MEGEVVDGSNIGNSEGGKSDTWAEIQPADLTPKTITDPVNFESDVFASAGSKHKRGTCIPLSLLAHSADVYLIVSNGPYVLAPPQKRRATHRDAISLGGSPSKSSLYLIGLFGC